MTECRDCKWIGCAVLEKDVSREGLHPVYVCRLDGYRVFLQLMACGRFERQEPGRPMKPWTGPVKERKGDDDA
jgi:hypothetical protein